MPRPIKELTRWKAQSIRKMSNLHSEISQKHDSLQAEISQKYDNLQYSILRLSNQQQVQEKRKFPSQTQPNPRGLHEVSSSSEPDSLMDEVKAIITLRSGKELNQPTPKAVKQGQEAEETEPKGGGDQADCKNK